MDLENRLNIEVEIQFLVKISFSLCLAASPREPLPFHLNTSMSHWSTLHIDVVRKLKGEKEKRKKEKKQGRGWR